jgi:hypothetical protein
MFSPVKVAICKTNEYGSSGMLRRVVCKFADVSEILAAFIIVLMIEAASTSETSVNFYHTTRRNNPEDSHLHTG